MTSRLHVLMAAAAMLVAVTGPSLAASRAQRASDAYASGAVSADRSGAYYYGPQGAQNANAQDRAQDLAQDRAQAVEAPYDRGQSQPYPDRPYGDPDSW